MKEQAICGSWSVRSSMTKETGGSSSGEQTDDGDRRRFLKALGALGVTGAAGCLGGDDGGTPTDTATPQPTDDTDTATDTTTVPTTGTPDGTPDDTPTDTPTDTPSPSGYAVLVLSVTDGNRRDSISAGNQALQDIGDELAGQSGIGSFDIEVIDGAVGDVGSEVPASAEDFGAYDAVVFQNTTGSILTGDQQSAFQTYVEDGGGFVGIHAAAETHTDWDWYAEDVLGATATGSPQVQEAEIHVTDRTHPATEHLPARWTREDQWYDFADSPRGDVHVLATLDERTYDGANMNAGFGRDHPIAWCRTVEQGRAFYTGGGHTTAAFGADAFQEHLKGALLWAVGHAGSSAYGTVWDAYEVETLFQGGVEPLELQVLPDGRVMFVERKGGGGTGRPNPNGAVRILDPGSGNATTALEIPIFLMEDTMGYPIESGLLGLTLDPDFEENGWLYVYYTTETDDGVINRASRFTLEGSSIDPGSETVIIEIPHFGLNHQGGALTFDTQGNLYIGTGDDTTPFESSGYAPIDEVSTPNTFDAQRTSGNTNDMRGSVLRITPQDDGGYEIPEGNLFTEENGYGDVDDSLVKKEIYGMGFRNPFTVKIDPEGDVPYVGDYGPDNGSWSADRGPPGQTEFERADEPGFYGWPYFKGKNIPYRHYDFDTGESGRIFDPENPINDSTKNDGLEELPPATGCMITNPYSWGTLLNNPPEWDEYMPYESVEEVPFPQINGGAPTQGPVYRHQEGYTTTSALPESYEGKIFIAEYGVGWIKYVTIDDDGEPLEVDPFIPGEDFSSPIDMTLGPEGSLYILDYAAGSITRVAPGDDVLPVSLSLDGGVIEGREIRVSSRTPVDVSAEIANGGSGAIADGEITLDASSSDIEVSADGGTTFDSLSAGGSQTAEWTVTLPADLGSGSYSLDATATYTSDGTEYTVSSSVSFSVQ